MLVGRHKFRDWKLRNIRRKGRKKNLLFDEHVSHFTLLRVLSFMWRHTKFPKHSSPCVASTRQFFTKNKSISIHVFLENLGRSEVFMARTSFVAFYRQRNIQQGFEVKFNAWKPIWHCSFDYLSMNTSKFIAQNDFLLISF